MKVERKELFGWYFYDWAISAFSSTVITVLLSPYLTSIAESAALAGGSETGMLDILGIQIFSGSYFSYVVSLSVFLQVIFLPLLGALADYTNRKKRLLGIFAYIGAFSTMLMYFIEGTNYLLGGALLIIANLSFGASMVIYNAYLNELTDEKDRDSVSSKGWAFGYLGGGILLALNMALIMMADGLGITTEMAVRISLASAGVWWAGFTIIPMLRLKRRRPLNKLPEDASILTFGFKQLYQTFKDAKKYPVTFRFLLAYLIYNDGVQAVIIVASQFAILGLGFEQEVVMQVILMVQFVAFGGALLFNYVAKAFSTKTSLLISLVIWSATVIASYLFVETELQFFILGAVIALVLGGTQALSRSMYSLFIPENKEAEYFSLYEISERGTSWIGPMIFGLSLQMTQSYKIAILSLLVFFVIGFLILLTVNVKRGITEAGNEVSFLRNAESQ